MRQYFEKMTPIGRGLGKNERERQEADAREIARVEQEVAQAIEERKDSWHF